MPRPRIAMRKIREVLRLALGEGLSRRQASAASGVPLTTVGDCLRRASAADLKWPLPGDLDDAGLEALLYPAVQPKGSARPLPDWGRVHKELRRKGVTLQLLWLEYREAHPDGYGYSQFANLYRAWRGQVDVTMRQSHRAGEKLFVDFPGDTVPVWDQRTGEISQRAELFVAVMGASNWLYAGAFASQELLYWITAHVHCFEAMAGCPQIVVCDNLRSGVSRPHRYEPDVNATFAEMAGHYGAAVIPARACKPRDKAKAESGGAAGRKVDHRPAPRPEVLLPGRGERGDQGLRGGDQRPAVPEAGRQPPVAVRAAGPPGAAAAARRPVRVRDLAESDREHRLPPVD